MIRRIAIPLAALAVLASPLAAQLEMITVPKGALRIELGGDFFPTDNIWLNGSHIPLGGLLTTPSLDATQTPMVSALESSLSKIFGHAATGASLGGITSIAEHQHGVGTINLGVGVTRRISFFMNVPIVYLRTRSAISYDSATATVGINPADQSLGTISGQGQTTTFFSQFDAALDTLQKHVTAGSYAGDPATLAVAQQTLASGPALRTALFTLLADPKQASVVLPTAASADGVALLAQIAQLESTFSNRLGINGFSTNPALPATPLTTATFGQVLAASNGFGLVPSTDLPRWALGDITAGVTAELIHRVSESGRSLTAWGEATVRFPNAQAADATVLFDQAADPVEPSATLAGVVETSRHGAGIRGELEYEHALGWSEFERLGTPDQLLIPAAFNVAIHRQPGDIMTLTARPFLPLAEHLAFTGLVQYWRQGASSSSYLAGEAGVAGIDPSVLDIGSAANAVVVGIGLSYSHDGRARDGAVGLPVEAGFSIERTVSSSAGLVPAPLTSKVYFRIYKSLFKP